jgi:flagellar hook-associated protein 1 FlgK
VVTSTFSGISTALNALMAQRTAVNVTGQNIANANTVGYTRQRAELTAIERVGLPGQYGNRDQVGWGVNVTSVQRLNDAFVDARQRDARASAAYADSQASALGQLESILGEPSDTGLSTQLDAFWASWQAVATQPDNIAARQGVLSKATTLASSLQQGRGSVERAFTDERTRLGTLVDQVNTAADGVAALNDRIRISKVNGNPANELADQRDQLVLQLSELVGARVFANDDGTVNVSVGGTSIVTGISASHLSVSGGGTVDTLDSQPLRLFWPTGSTATIPGGAVAGSVDALTNVYANAVEGYDRVAASLIADVNSLHTAAQDLDGAPGGVFFTVPAVTGQEAKGIAVAIDNPRKVAASAPAGGATLDGSVADGIAQLRTTGRAGNDWGSLVADTGVKSRQAQDRSIVQTAIATQADGARDSASGVSIDEEMTNMLMYQRAYEGAARVMTAVDEMLDTLVNRLGTVGR